MAQAHKGPRTQVKMWVPDVILDRVHHDQLEHGVEQRSQFIADLLCVIYDMKGLVRELDPAQLELPLPPLRTTGDVAHVTVRPDADERGAWIKVRVPDPVMRRVKRDVVRINAASWSRFIADLLCHVYARPDLASQVLRREEQLKLPIPVRHEPAA